MTEHDLHVSEMMEKYGGGFVKALSVCIRKADDVNIEKLRAAFPEYWEKYAEMYDRLYAENDE